MVLMVKAIVFLSISKTENLNIAQRQLFFQKNSMTTKNFDTPSSSSHIASIDIAKRRDFIIQNQKEFQMPITDKYLGTEKQNTALLKFLKNNSVFRQKWESELMTIQSSSSTKKVEIRSETKAQVDQISDKDKPTFPARTPGEFLATHGIDLSVAPAGMRNNNPFNIKWTNSDFQKRILVDAVEPSKNKDQ